jgi:hypothetical protein
MQGKVNTVQLILNEIRRKYKIHKKSKFDEMEQFTYQQLYEQVHTSRTFHKPIEAKMTMMPDKAALCN